MNAGLGNAGLGNAGLEGWYRPLVDEGLTLRRAVHSDAADIAEVYNEADVQHWMLWDPEVVDEAEALANIRRSEEAWAEGSNAPFRIVVDGHVVGGVNLNLQHHQVAEVAYFLRASARGRGLATRSVLMVSDWGFRECGLARIQLRADLANEASVGVAERAGFAFEGIERSSAAYPDGRRFDSRVYSLLPSDRVCLRPATLDDVEFLTTTATAANHDRHRPADADLATYRAGFVEWTEQQVRGEIPDSTTSVVTAYGVDLGRLRVVRTPGLVELAGLQRLP